jgi:uncharacterized membrane protein YfcA
MALSATLVLTFMIFAVAALYSTVGHAGASGYLASMALFGLAPATMKPTALCLNILVALIASAKFATAGCFNWRVFWPFALSSVPAAFLGGALTLPAPIYKQIVGLVLLYSAYRLFVTATTAGNQPLKPLPVPVGIAVGAVLGCLSGLTGVGGGIFLSPILLFCCWADARQASGVSAVFILVNSIAGLAGHVASLAVVPGEVLWWAPSAALGGVFGSHWGSRRLPGPAIRRCLSAVLLVAGAKMILV